jgi:hypothetical protein
MWWRFRFRKDLFRPERSSEISKLGLKNSRDTSYRLVSYGTCEVVEIE